MINLAVIELKDIIKYLVKITIVISIVVILTKYFSNLKTKLNVEKSSFLACFDTVIPSIKNVNKKEENVSDKKTNFEPLKMALDVELSMIDSIEENSEGEESSGTENTGNEINQGENVEELKEAETGLETEVLENNVPEKYTVEYNGVKIKNETDNIKLTEEMLVPDVDINMKNILIYHTHSCESYTPTEQYTYEASGNFRTKDKNYSVIRVGTELTNYLKHYGYNVIHDTSYHDYPSYNGSYTNSLKTVESLLQTNPSDIIIDLHRDAIGSRSDYAPTVRIGDEEAAQIMFVIGTNAGGLWHPNWNQNLKFAIKLQEKAEELYPGLFKPIMLTTSRYNQHTGKYANIMEVGATGNTLEQCLTSMKYLAKVIDEIMK